MDKICTLGIAAALAVLASSPVNAQQIQWWGDPPLFADTPPTSLEYIGIAEGPWHFSALLKDGSILAYNPIPPGTPPYTITKGPFRNIAIAEFSTFALRPDGKIESWFHKHPDFPTSSGWIDIDARGLYAIAVHGNGSLKAWGSSPFGHVQATPTTGSFTRVSAGIYHAIALRADGSIHSWGRDLFGLISGTPAGNNFIQVEAGHHHSVALRADGTIVSWGFDQDGVVSNTPTTNGFIEIAASRRYALARRSDGSIAAWGDIAYAHPSAVPQGPGFASIEAGDGYAYAIMDLDCNGNGQYDFIDISSGVSQDLDGNKLPDECDPDCNANGVPDIVDIRSGASIDLDHNWIPDECEPDCNSNGVVDTFDIQIGTSSDLDQNGIPDECEPDCNGNGVVDAFDVSSGTSPDCNANLIPDECDVLMPGADIDGDGILDECLAPPLMADTYTLSLASGGVQTMALIAPYDAFGFYFLLGSVTGTSPGVSAGAFTLPLNSDAYMTHTASMPNSPPLTTSFGSFLGQTPGEPSTFKAKFTLPTAFDPMLAGTVLHHAFVTFHALTGDVLFVSNAIPLTLLP